jgi:hypothetical protein
MPLRISRRYARTSAAGPFFKRLSLAIPVNTIPITAVCLVENDDLLLVSKRDKELMEHYEPEATTKAESHWEKTLDKYGTKSFFKKKEKNEED